MLLGDAGPRSRPASVQEGDVESVPNETNPGFTLSLIPVRTCAYRHAERLGRRMNQGAATLRILSPAPRTALPSDLLPSLLGSGRAQPLTARSRSAGCLAIRQDQRPPVRPPQAARRRRRDQGSVDALARHLWLALAVRA